jgi:hypothetical protein
MHGTGVPIVTPFDSSGRVDRAQLRALVDWLEDRGVDFLVPCGSSGEAPLLTTDERITVVETVAEATVFTGGRAVTTGYADELGNTEDAIAAAAADAGVSNYQVSYRDPAQPQTALLGLSGTDTANSTVTVEQSPLDDNGVDRVRFLMLYGTLETETVPDNGTDQGGVRDE